MFATRIRIEIITCLCR